MTQATSIEQTRKFIEEKFAGEGSGHDWAHMYRVWQLSQTIAASEPDADREIVELGALLHDIADWKFHDGDDSVGPREARKWLESLELPEETIAAVEHIVANISFHASLDKNRPSLSLEAKIVHDADKLDAIGAIGIARTFVYSGTKGRPMYDPAIKPKTHDSIESYRKGNENNTTINHFYEKLLLLKDMMLTETGKSIAQKRHDYMLQYLDEFYAEWNGER
jgi:uncharacterized protein